MIRCNIYLNSLSSQGDLSLGEALHAGVYVSREGKASTTFLLLVSVSSAVPEAWSPLFEQELPEIYVTICLLWI